MTVTAIPQQRLAFSFENLVASATVTASSAHAKYTANSVKKIGSPYFPWKTTTTGAQSLVMDFGEAITPGIFALSRVNVDTVHLQAHTSDVWTTPDEDFAITVAQNRDTYRYQYGALLPAGLSYQYWRLLIPSQTPVDGDSVYLVGGIWLGDDVTFPPTHVDYQIQVDTERPSEAVDTKGGGSRVTTTGNPFVRFTMKRTPRTTRILPGQNPGPKDHLEAWAAIDRKIYAAGRRFLFMRAQTDTTETYVVDDTGSRSTSRTSQQRMATTMVFTEAGGP